MKEISSQLHIKKRLLRMVRGLMNGLITNRRISTLILRKSKLTEFFFRLFEFLNKLIESFEIPISRLFLFRRNLFGAGRWLSLACRPAHTACRRAIKQSLLIIQDTHSSSPSCYNRFAQMCKIFISELIQGDSLSVGLTQVFRHRYAGH